MQYINVHSKIRYWGLQIIFFPHNLSKFSTINETEIFEGFLRLVNNFYVNGFPQTYSYQMKLGIPKNN